MPSYRNPSLFLSQSQVDDIADRILEGKYCKWPVRPTDVFHAGFYGEGAYLKGYIESRFKLTPAGVTRRSNKFQLLVNELARKVSHSTPTAIWKVKRGYYDSNGATYVMGPGGTEAEKIMLKEGAMLMWGWMWLADRPGTTARDLALDLVGLGGERELAIRLNGVAQDVADRAQRKRKELEGLQKICDELDSKAQMVVDMVQMINMQNLDAQLASGR